MPKYTEEQVEKCARAAHAVNKTYCEHIGDFTQVSWIHADAELQETVRKGVREVLEGRGDPAALHEVWFQNKLASGWKYGKTKDPVAKTHPCMVPYCKLPVHDRAKDQLFAATIEAVFSVLREDEAKAQVDEQTAKIDELTAAVKKLNGLNASWPTDGWDGAARARAAHHRAVMDQEKEVERLSALLPKR